MLADALVVMDKHSMHVLAKGKDWPRAKLQ